MVRTTGEPRPKAAIGWTVIDALSLRDQAINRIRAQIVSGALTPGVLYPIGMVASELQVSITPVREALLDLVGQGLIEMVRNRGFMVRRLEDEDLDELVELRRMLEVPAIRQIASRGRALDLGPSRQLAKALRNSVRRGEMVEFVDLDRQFHLQLLSLHGNKRMVSVVATLRDQTRLYGLTKIVGSEDLAASNREHDQLLDAIAQEDASAAAAVMERHLTHARGIWAGKKESIGRANSALAKQPYRKGRRRG